MGSHLQAGGDRVWFDFFDLVGGGLDKIRYGLPDVAAESLFEKFYGDLADHLEASHAVVPFAYDWRRPIEESATELANVVTQQLAGHPDQPVRLLAHSMGGLVVRAMLAGKPEIWNKIVARPGGRFIMLGTPNNGSHAMVETLLGKSSAVRNLARIDLRHDLQEVLDIVAGFPGALQLLPRPGFADTGQSQVTDYLDDALWEEYRRSNQDRWFGNGVVGVPNAGDLQTARRLWEQTLLEKAEQAGPWRHTPISHPERIAYVFGQADNTPCGVKAEGRQLKMIGTPQGDGSVTWSAGRLDFLPEDRYWYIPVSHGDLAGTTEHFPALDDLLQTGSTDKLGRLPVSRGEQRGEETVRIYDAGPVPYPGEEELARSLLGGKPQPRQARIEPRSLRVSVIAMDLRFAQHPVICGHYTGDAISGAEAQIDQALVGGALTKRKRLGKYVGEIGTSAVVLAARTEEEIERGTGRGAVIVGLGEWGRLAVHQVTEAVRAGVLDYLLQQLDRDSENRTDADRKPREFKLASVLIGYNSTTNISVEASVEAVVRGVCLANRQFQETMGSPLRVGKLEFLELFRDTAITAAVAVRDLPQRLEKDRKQLGTRIEAGTELREGEGVRPRLQVSESFGYWPRLIVTAADRSEDDSEEPDRGEPLPTALAERLKYVLLSERARAEAIVEQRQPGLVEALVRDAIKSVKFDRDISRTLFQLLVPLDLKSVARQTPRLLLAVDGYTANLPWEMLQADDEPLAVRTALVRQLVSTCYRQGIRRAVSKTACVVGDPSTEGYYKHYFGDSGNRDETRLVRLDGAAQEADAVRQTLEKAGYAVQFLQRDASKLDVFNALYREPYRILMIAAHGMYNALRRDGGRRSGVVLSDGIMLTAAELNRMEVVPDVVFLNCCHLGQVDATPRAYNRLAYSISRELIEMGVRCVVAAGWSVNDAAACDFARAFFGALVEDGKPFGESVWIARKVACDGYPDLNTWGAYQAYGDPSYRLDHDERDREESIWKPVSPQELTERLTGLRIAHKHEQAKDHQKTAKKAKELLRGVPPAWQDLPEVQFALGDLYGELGPENFESAQQAYLRAIAEEDMSGRVPLRAIEQLANLEARTGEKKGGKEGLALIDRAITGLTGLLEISMPMTGEKEAAAKTGSAEARRMNVERWSLLGSAWKRKAAVLAADDPQGMLAALEKSRRAYASCEGTTSDEDFNPYAMLNRLQLDGILGGLSANEVSERVHLAGQCARSARQRFARTYSFWDAVMSADAQLAKRLLDRSLPNSAEVLVKSYQEAIERVPKSARELDSVVKQLRLFAKFLRPKDDKSATALDKVAGRLEGPYAPGLPSATPVSPAPDESGPAASAPATAAAPPAAGKRRLSKRKSSAQPKSGRKRTRATRPRKRKPRG